VRDSSGEVYNFTTYNSDNGDNTVNGQYHDILLEILLNKGKSFKFIGISDKYGSMSEYKFTIDNADYLEKALSKIK
jgi:hypothetical protein